MERNVLTTLATLDVSDAFLAFFRQQRDPLALAPTTPLHVATLNGDIRGVELELTKGRVLVSTPDVNGYTALHHAALLGRERIAALLLEHGASVDIAAADGNTPLHKAAQGGHLTIAKVLIGAGADPTKVNLRGERPIDVCATRKHTELTAFLRGVVGVVPTVGAPSASQC